MLCHQKWTIQYNVWHRNCSYQCQLVDLFGANIMNRFEVKENTPNSYGVFDTKAKDFHRPENVPAVSIYMTFEGANRVCDIMNAEWKHFLNNPK